MAPSNFNFLKAEVLSSENLFSWSFLQLVACPLSEQLVWDKKQQEVAAHSLQQVAEANLAPWSV